MVAHPTPARTPTTSMLFQPARVGNMHLKHRVVLAPLTRLRANAAHVPHPIVTEYYSQRASVPGTLLVTEATLITHQAGGYAHVPGIWSDEQISRWKDITEVVHTKGSYIYLQLWALGRTAVPGKPGMEADFPYDHVSASNISMSREDPQKPRPLTISEIKEYTQWFAVAAKNAVEGAGFDGVEIHGANGYLLDQFLQDVSNDRTDEYGGSVEKRARFPLEVVDAVAKAVGAERTAIRLSPWSEFQGMRMSDPKPTFRYFVEELKKAHPTFSYIHVVEPRSQDDPKMDLPEGESLDFLREVWTQEESARWFISAGGADREIGIQTADDKGDLVAYGRWFLSNPDLPYRLEHNIPFNAYDRSTFYVADGKVPEGYTDYPFALKIE
ncbi:NADH:flavin oxidoreductase/NADH oxidase [Rhodocollybia butyracea]|uniref:NADH:flavin oxidoreductase/NADH oxidase n=1 Tax=Rhodocollybia butyracea TaxID=206335 RepID=A0A9P5Q8C5_9AGAR|nr:NADH:flavin oxidoreductase/NADH oxidase [Rhodocollybia butyracea]